MSELAERVVALLAKHAGRRVGLVAGVRAGGETGYWHRGLLPDGARIVGLASQARPVGRVGGLRLLELLVPEAGRD